MTAAAASALAAAAIVALPAVGDDSNPNPSPAALAACLRSHGLDGAPDDPVALKTWIGERQAQDPDGVKRAMIACEEYQTGGPDKPKVEEKRRSLSDADVAKIVACIRANGLDAPSDPVALKGWLAQEEQSHPDDVARVMPKCKMQLDPMPPPKDGKPADCGGDAARQTEPAAKPEDSTT